MITNMEWNPTLNLTLRQKGKARRYGGIVAAAEDLWRRHGFEAVSVNQIAAAAEVAPQTVYNLIGGLDAIGFAVIERSLGRLDHALKATSATGVELALASARLSAEIYTADARLYRQLLVRIPRALFDGTHLGRDVAEIVILAMTDAQANGQISARVDPERLGRAIYTAYLGALYDWACGDSSDKAFMEAGEVAVLAPVVACATDAARPTLAARLFQGLTAPA